MCLERGTPDNFGSEPKCAFETGAFSPDNWMCATMIELRRLAEDSWRHGEDGGNFSFRESDSSLATLWFYDGEDDYSLAKWLVMTFYKSRGRTSRAYVLCDDDEPTVLTLQQAEYALRDWSEPQTVSATTIR